MTTEAEAKQKIAESLRAWQDKEGRRSSPMEVRQKCRTCGQVFCPDSEARICPYCGAKNPAPEWWRYHR